MKKQMLTAEQADALAGDPAYAAGAMAIVGVSEAVETTFGCLHAYDSAHRLGFGDEVPFEGTREDLVAKACEVLELTATLLKKIVERGAK